MIQIQINKKKKKKIKIKEHHLQKKLKIIAGINHKKSKIGVLFGENLLVEFYTEIYKLTFLAKPFFMKKIKK
jgi:hypothetical protein